MEGENLRHCQRRMSLRYAEERAGRDLRFDPERLLRHRGKARMAGVRTETGQALPIGADQPHQCFAAETQTQLGVGVDGRGHQLLGTEFVDAEAVVPSLADLDRMRGSFGGGDGPAADRIAPLHLPRREFLRPDFQMALQLFERALAITIRTHEKTPLRFG